MADGFRADFNRFLEVFISTDSVRFEDFVKTWKEMNFHLVFYGLKKNKDQRLFLEEAFLVALSYLQPTHTFQIRICALYVLYGLYYIQPCSPKVKIRMSVSLWRDTLKLINDVRHQQHLDTDYVFRRMKMDKAFVFVASTLKMGAGGLKSKEVPSDTDLFDTQCILNETFDEEALEQLGALHKEYYGAKCEISGTDKPDKSLNLLKDPANEFILESVQKYNEWRSQNAIKKKNRVKKVSKEDSQSDTSSDYDDDNDYDHDDEEWLPQDDSTSSRADRIARLKAKSFNLQVDQKKRASRKAANQSEANTSSKVMEDSQAAENTRVSDSPTNSDIIEAGESSLSMPLLEVEEARTSKKRTQKTPKNKKTSRSKKRR